MKKILLLILLMIPFMVKAVDTCNTNDLKIESMVLSEKSNNVQEIESASFDGQKINVNLRMHRQGDYAKYQMNIKNTSDNDYEIDKNNIAINSDYFDYSLSYEGSNIIKPGEVKGVSLIVTYANSVPEATLLDGPYEENKNMALSLSSDNTVVNPSTQTGILTVVIVLLLGVNIIVFLTLRNNTAVKYTILILSIATIIPLTVNALCKSEFNVDSKIVVNKPYTGIIYRSSPIQYHNNEEFIFEQLWCRPVLSESDNQSDCYRTKATCEEGYNGECARNNQISTNSGSELRKGFYLKHELDDGNILTSYACYVGDNGEYCFKGGDPAAYEENEALFIELFGNTGASYRIDEEGIHSSGTHSEVLKDGTIRMGNYCGACWVMSDSKSYCAYGPSVC